MNTRQINIAGETIDLTQVYFVESMILHSALRNGADGAQVVYKNAVERDDIADPDEYVVFVSAVRTAAPLKGPPSNWKHSAYNNRARIRFVPRRYTPLDLRIKYFQHVLWESITPTRQGILGESVPFSHYKNQKKDALREACRDFAVEAAEIIAADSFFLFPY